MLDIQKELTSILKGVQTQNQESVGMCSFHSCTVHIDNIYIVADKESLPHTSGDEDKK